MNIYNYLKKDHLIVLELFDKILSTKSLDKRKAFFQEVGNELLLHAETENKTFYAALEEYKETAELIDHAIQEHEEVKDYITKLSAISVESEKWLEQFGELKHSVTHHVKEEESDIFKRAKNILSTAQANQLAVDMAKLKDELRSS